VDKHGLKKCEMGASKEISLTSSRELLKVSSLDRYVVLPGRRQTQTQTDLGEAALERCRGSLIIRVFGIPGFSRTGLHLGTPGLPSGEIWVRSEFLT